jgi:hypothetical protein
MGCFEKINPGQFYKAVFMPTASIWYHGPISYRFLREATIIISYRFLFEATGTQFFIHIHLKLTIEVMLNAACIYSSFIGFISCIGSISQQIKTNKTNRTNKTILNN